MLKVEAGALCPNCGAEIQYCIIQTVDAPPEAIKALKRAMAAHAVEQRLARHSERSLMWIRFLWYVVAFMSAWAGFARAFGPEMIPTWAAVVANATTAMVAMTAAMWVVDLKQRATR